MKIYEEILKQAGDSAQAAGLMHEHLWVALKSAEDPSFHNVRIGRGDGGLDGLTLVDPLIGGVIVYQAKFFKDLSSTQHRDDVIDSFVRAIKNPFPIQEWCLLVPVKLSAPEIGWLIGGDFKKSARKKLAEPLRAKIDACGIRYCEGNQLEALCLRHIERAAGILPKSTIALLQKIEEGRTEVDFLQKEIADRLKLFNQNAVRSREAESRNALSALKILNQGWADCSIPLRLTKDASGMEAAARELVTFVQTKAQLGFLAESLAPGTSHQISDIYLAARRLVFNSLAFDIQNASRTKKRPFSELNNEAEDLIRVIRTLQEGIYYAITSFS